MSLILILEYEGIEINDNHHSLVEHIEVASLCIPKADQKIGLGVVG